MKSEEMHDLSDRDLRLRLEDSRKELFNLRFQIETRKIKNHQRIPVVKKDIARMRTALRERELMRMYGGEDAEFVGEQEATPVEQAPRRRRLFGRR